MRSTDPVRISTDVPGQLADDIDRLSESKGMSRATYIRVKLMGAVRQDLAKEAAQKAMAS